MTNKLKQFWKYLNTSHGTRWDIIGYDDGGGYYSDTPIFGEVPDYTPLKKTIIASIVLGVISLGALGIGSCSYKIHRALELRDEMFARVIPDHGSLEYMLGEKQAALTQIDWLTQISKRFESEGFENDFCGKDIKHQKEKIKEIDKKVENFKKQIKMKVEKGYLNKNDEQWGSYSVIYENEPWWPEDANSINLKK